MNSPLATLIVDDEPPARDRLKMLVEQHPDLVLVGTCTHGREALDCLRETDIDLLLLDIQMPGMSGLDVVSALPRNKYPALIFVTAFDRYAIEAFDRNAVDYLLKPYSDSRFHKAVDRVTERIRPPAIRRMEKQLHHALDQLEKRRQNSAASVDQLGIRLLGKIYFIDVVTIEYVHAAGNYLEIKAGRKTHLLRASMSGLIRRLPSDQFVRTHRSTILNRRHILEVTSIGGGDYNALMTDQSIKRISRTYRDSVFKKLGL